MKQLTITQIQARRLALHDSGPDRDRYLRRFKILSLIIYRRLLGDSYNGLYIAPGLTRDQLQAINMRFPTTLQQLINMHNELPVHHRTEAIIEMACKIGIGNFYSLIKYLKHEQKRFNTAP